MADSSLDDFFAKKDKSKKKTKSKTTANEVASTPVSLGKKPMKKRKDNEKQPASATEDQEWLDYEPETEKDYSGLRIQNLQIKPEDDDDMENDFNNENDELNEAGERRESNSGPWNKSGQRSTTPTPPVIKDEEPSPVVEETPSKPGGRYVPPGQRGMSSGMTPTEARMARIRNSKKEAPNIHCEVDFPTLGGAGNDFEVKDFERVRGGNRNYEDPSNNSLQLKLNNKYRALQD